MYACCRHFGSRWWQQLPCLFASLHSASGELSWGDIALPPSWPVLATPRSEPAGHFESAGLSADFGTEDVADRASVLGALAASVRAFPQAVVGASFGLSRGRPQPLVPGRDPDLGRGLLQWRRLRAFPAPLLSVTSSR
jgi:hypothetical protein